MRNFAKFASAGAMLAIVFSASSCNAQADLIMWTGFGSSYTTAVEALCTNYNVSNGVLIEHQSQGGYDKLQTNIMNSVSTASYPNFANGYPDHFAGYIKAGIQLPLDDYISAYDAEHGTNLLDDYYSEYMVENKTLRYKADGVTGYVMGVPFNKSTEVMAYNGYFVDYAKSLDATVVIPETWDGWTVEGPKFMNAMSNLYGKYLTGQIDDDGKASNFAICNTEADVKAGDRILLDCSLITADKFRLMCWDSAANMFITLVRQWGSQYTSYSAADIKNPQHGWAEYYTGATNKERTINALKFFNEEMYANKLFGLPADMSDTYSSNAFKYNSTMFVICSSGGLSYNIADTRVRLAPIPYKVNDFGEGDADYKYVISQGTNLALFDQGTTEDQQKAFNAIVDFTTGKQQAVWSVTTGYYPSSKSATNNEVYQTLLNEKQSDPTKRAYQESAVLNEKYYMDADSGWNKFVDPGFVGSSSIRSEVDTIMGIVFGHVDCVGKPAADVPYTYDQVLQASYGRIDAYVKK